VFKAILICSIPVSVIASVPSVIFRSLSLLPIEKGQPSGCPFAFA
jgi:hypothetical protein